MTDNVIWGIDFSKPKEPIRTREDAIDELARQFRTMLDNDQILIVEHDYISPPCDSA